MGIMIKSICTLPCFNNAGKPMYCHIHKTELCVIGCFLLSIKGHGTISIHPRFIYKVPGLNKHPPWSTRRIKQNSTLGFKYIDNHLHKRFWCKEHTIIWSDALCKLVQKILINSSDNISSHFIQCRIVKNTKEFWQYSIGKICITFRKNTY